jgi:hypothetical protein
MRRRTKSDTAQSRHHLSRNLNTLIELEVASSTALIAAGAVTSSTLNRIRHGENAATLDRVDALAHALGVQVWQLLHPDTRVALLLPTQVRVLDEFAAALQVLTPRELAAATKAMRLAMKPLIDAAAARARSDEERDRTAFGGARRVPLPTDEDV